MQRRTYLRVAAAAGVAGLAGCAGGDGGTPDGGDPQTTPDPYQSENTHLAAPDLDGPPEAYPWPVHSQRLPEVTLPAPLSDTEVTTTQFDTPVFVTFFYTNCQTTCPRLIGALRNLQAEAGKNGETDALNFLPITFDPQRDTADTLDSYVDRMSVDREAGNWHFLRPDGKPRAEAVVDETFGILFERTHPEDMDMYMFDHRGVILLANSDGYVERAYRENFTWDVLYEDFQTLRDAEA